MSVISSIYTLDTELLWNTNIMSEMKIMLLLNKLLGKLYILDWVYLHSRKNNRRRTVMKYHLTNEIV